MTFTLLRIVLNFNNPPVTDRRQFFTNYAHVDEVLKLFQPEQVNLKVD
jgi:hypothetical protein